LLIEGGGRFTAGYFQQVRGGREKRGLMDSIIKPSMKYRSRGRGPGRPRRSGGCREEVKQLEFKFKKGLRGGGGKRT